MTIITLLPAAVFACSTPVFQYALERWSPEVYDVEILCRGSLKEADEEIVRSLKSLSEDENAPANINVSVIDIAQESDSARLAGYGDLSKTESSAIVLRYPRMREPGQIVWTGRLTLKNAEALCRSPVRQDIAQRLVRGEIVWLMIESGNRDKDGRAEEVLKTALAGVTNQAVDVADAAYYMKPRFSLVRVSRTDETEAVLLAILLGSESDLSDYANEPVVFPVYGRGRAFLSLVGNGIHEDNIMQMAYFLIGPCACEIKMGNPGIDLLITANWLAAFELMPDAPAEQPPVLTGVFPVTPVSTGDLSASAAMETESGNASRTVKSAVNREDETDGTGLTGAAIASIAGILAIVVVANLALGRKKEL